MVKCNCGNTYFVLSAQYEYLIDTKEDYTDEEMAVLSNSKVIQYDRKIYRIINTTICSKCGTPLKEVLK